MPDIIRLLPESIANQIAAGEVVQRPASVVKELLENSLDASASSVKLIFRDGGQTSIQVVDDGKGMSDTDARMCWERHATSKIKEANDLYQLNTFGFRGEALASIASVSIVEMKSKIESDTLGTKIVIEAGDVKKQEPISSPTGTSITVKNLFYNIPVRRNFLKSISVETKYIIEEFQRCAISSPEIEMSLYNGEHEVYKLRKSNLEGRIQDVLTNRSQGKLLAVEEATAIVGVTGFIGSPEKARKTRGDQFLFVNGRYIREPYFHHAISHGYEGLIETDFHPFYVLFLEVHPEKIDVNVHPTKTEVKFEDGKAIYAIIKSVVQKGLASYHTSPIIEPIPGLYPETTFGYDRKETQTFNPPSTLSKSGFNPFSEKNPRTKQDTHWEKLYEPFRDDIVEPKKEQKPQAELLPSLDEVRIGKVFQLLGKYIVGEINGQLYIFHQQFAHERVLFETYNMQLREGQTASQQLLFPRTLDLQPIDYSLLISLNEELVQLGFDISPFGKNSVIVNGTPGDIKKGEESDMIEGILETFKQNEQKLKLDRRENLSQSLAKSAAMKPGTYLTEEGMRGLLQSLFNCSHPGHTPSGKPVMVTFEPNQIEGFFTT
jgi:DNA mismatch repair protein MutL